MMQFIVLCLVLQCVVVMKGQQRCGINRASGARSSICHSTNGACRYDSCIPKPTQGELVPPGCAATWSGPSCQRKNEAQLKVTKQKSTWETNSEGAHSALAVDGYTYQDFFTPSGANPLSCTHTAQKRADYPWWEVNFGELVEVFYIKIWNRADCCADRLNRFIVSAKNTTIVNTSPTPSSVGTRCYSHDNSTEFSTLMFTCEQPVTTQYINIMIPLENAPRLVLCEVELHVCADYWFGEDCSKQCYCYDVTEVCNKFDGSCPVSRCAAGKTGTDCQQECLPGMYGYGCTETCNCYAGAVCDRFEGSCTECAVGYRGTYCQRECGGQTFGRGCLSTCNCRNTIEQCGHINGNCSSGCAAGFQGLNCSIKCPSGRYSYRCNKACNCYDDAPCGRFDGICAECAVGYQGADCQQECNGLKFGRGCISTCHCRDMSEQCGHADGNCVSGCPDGFTGRNCSLPCEPGLFGFQCLGVCHCKGGAAACDTTNGECNGDCSSGYLGTNCRLTCADGNFGDNCNIKCNCKEANDICSHISGACKECAYGFKGIDCLAGCDTGEFGSGCDDVCHCTDNSQCSPQNGTCGQAGCAAGYSGGSCQIISGQNASVGDPDEESPVMPIVVGVLAGLLLIGIVVGLVFFIRRRRHDHPTKDTPSSALEDTTIEHSSVTTHDQNIQPESVVADKSVYDEIVTYVNTENNGDDHIYEMDHHTSETGRPYAGLTIKK